MAGRPKLSAADWLEAEALFRAGALSNQEIASRFGVSETAIRQRARKAGWLRASADARQQLVEGKLLEQRAEGADASGLNIGQIAELQAADDARVLTEAAELFRDGIRQAREMLPHCGTPDQIKKVMDAGQVAAVGYMRVRRLDARPPEASPFEATVKRLAQEGKL